MCHTRGEYKKLHFRKALSGPLPLAKAKDYALGRGLPAFTT